MQTRINELISVNEQAALVKGVQLDWYGDSEQLEENARLATGYIFSSGRTSGHYRSAIDIFEKIRDSLSQPGSYNVFTVIAKYGHGKSHFALALANYFGSAPQDPVLEGILKQIEQCSDKNTAFHFRSFKENAAKPQLVVRLSGHNFTDLRQGFLRALRRALDEHEATRDYAIEAVCVNAATWLAKLTGQERKRAEEYLDENYQIELEDLIESLTQYDVSKEAMVRDVSKAIYTRPLDFGHDVDLSETINKVVDEFCTGKDAPFHKMVILFDELGIYSEKWCNNKMTAGYLAPQQILEACDDRRGRVCLVAFLQREMDEFVKNYVGQEEFTKWAKRFPKETCFWLETSLERVIKGLLIKKEEWDPFARAFVPQIERACEAAWQMLPSYQNKPDIWDRNKFKTIVGIGTFPLHPITTGLLCNLNFIQGGRTIIGFVSEAVREIEGQWAANSGQLNFVLPISLVDQFKGSFEGHEALYSLYSNAEKRLGSNVPEKLYVVLKALFLFYAGRLKRYDSQSHASVLAPLCGLREMEAQELLKQLTEEYSVTSFSQARKEYEFTGIGTSPVEIRQQLQQAVSGKTISSLAAKLDALTMIDRITPPESEANDFKARHAVEGDEWRLMPRFMDASKLDAERIKRMLAEIEQSGEARGLLVYAVSSDGVELDNATERAGPILNAFRFGEYPYPVVIAIPCSPAVGLEKEILMREELNGWGGAKREHYGESYAGAVQYSDRKLEDSLKGHLRDVRYCVTTIVEKRLKVGDISQLDHVADRLFEEGFPFRPPARANIMNPSKSQGNAAVAEVARHLLFNNVESGKLDQKKKNIVTGVLEDGTDKWGVLNARHRLQEPTHPCVLKAWVEELDAKIQENKPVAFRTLNARLRSVPYGYDDFTLTLLYAAWIGKNKNDLSFTGSLDKKDARPRTLSLNDIQGQLEKARDFVKWLDIGNVHIQRPGLGNKKKAKEYLTRVEASADYVKAKRILVEADEILSGLSADDELRTAVEAAVGKLEEQVKIIDEYLQKIRRYHESAEKAENVAILIKFAEELPSRPSTYLEFDETVFVGAKKFIEKRIQSTVEKRTQQPLKRIESYDALYREIEGLRDVLHKSGREDLRQLCVSALGRIKNEHNALVARQKEEQVVEKIGAIKIDDLGLASCRETATYIEMCLATDLINASDKNRQHVEKKRRQLSKRIAEYEQWVLDMTSQIAIIYDLKGAKGLRDQIVGREREFAATAEWEALQEQKQLLEAKLQALEEFEQAESKRKAIAVSHLHILRDLTIRITQAQSFEQAAREYQGLHTLPSLPDDVQLTEGEQQEVDTLTQKGLAHLNALLARLRQSKTFQNADQFRQRELELQRTLDFLNELPEPPAAWLKEVTGLLVSIQEALRIWYAEQEEEEKKRRQAEEEKCRAAHNQEVVETTLRLTSRAQSLREIQNAIASVNAVYSQLAPPCETQKDQLETEYKRLNQNEASLREWVNNSLSIALPEAWGTKAIQQLRQEIVRYEGQCADDAPLALALAEARTALDKRSELLSRLAAIERQTQTIPRCQESLVQVAALRTENPDGTEQITAMEGRLQTRIEELRAEERNKAEKWLSQFNIVSNGNISVQRASELLRKLDERPNEITEEDEPFLASIREKLFNIRDTDLVSRITDDFSKLQTSQQRAECLLKIAEICKAEGLSADYVSRLIDLLEARTLV